jgi:hypothetical protein
VDKKKAVGVATGAAAGVAASRAFDFALLGGLLATAAGVVGFAGYETMKGDHQPQIAGMEYLGIFGAPNRHTPAVESAARSGLDMNTLGALPHSAPETAGGYALVGAQSRFAWLREGNRIFAVSPGDDVPRLGRVASIETRDGRWALISPAGEILLTGGAADVGASGGGKFDKRMIFRSPG